MKSRISKRLAHCLKETLDSRAVVLSCPFSDLLFPQSMRGMGTIFRRNDFWDRYL